MKLKNFLKGIGIIIFYVILSVIQSTIFELTKTDNLFIDNLILSSMTIIIFVIIAALMIDKLSGQWKDFKTNFKKYISIALKCWFIGFIVMFIANLIINIFILKGIAPNEEANREIIKLYPFYSILSVAIFGPMTEELLFRLNFKNAFKNKTVFIVITGLLFGSMHLLSSTSLNDLLYIIPYTALGIAFSKAYVDTDNIYSSIFIHMIHNTLTLFIIMNNL